MRTDQIMALLLAEVHRPKPGLTDDESDQLEKGLSSALYGLERQTVAEIVANAITDPTSFLEDLRDVFLKKGYDEDYFIDFRHLHKWDSGEKIPFCCAAMKEHAERVCKDPLSDGAECVAPQCPDKVIWCDETQNKFGIIIHDGGTAFYDISFCPWCGKICPSAGFIDENETDK